MQPAALARGARHGKKHRGCSPSSRPLDSKLMFAPQLRPDATSCQAVTYNVGINACNGVGQWMLAQVLLEKSERTLIACNGFLGSCDKGALVIAGHSSYDSSTMFEVEGYHSGGHWQMSSCTLLDMRGQELEVSSISYSACITSQKRGRWSTALATLRTAQACNKLPEHIDICDISECKSMRIEKAKDPRHQVASFAVQIRQIDINFVSAEGLQYCGGSLGSCLQASYCKPVP